MLRFLTAGESHGPQLTVIVEGVPAGLPLDAPRDIDPDLRRRPGHADLAGVLKYGFNDARDVLERASARETAARVAAGAVGRTLIAALGVAVHSCVVRIGDIHVPVPDGELAWD